MTKTFSITTPIYYVNDVPHIGHAYTTLACDVLARFKRLDGYDVHFLTGTDEHGQKVEKSAAEAGMTPEDFTDKVSRNFRELAHAMDFSNDDFIRTTETRHRLACQDIWNRLLERDAIYLGAYSGWYAVRDEAYYGADELTKTPGGRHIAPSGAEVEWVEEPSYFFRLSAWQDRLLEFYAANPDFVMPKSRMNEVSSFVKGGLEDLSISRTSFKWGVPVPNDDAHIMYVWLDALTNYITALGYPHQEDARYQKWWPANIHMVGKDILRFHAVYWPAFLMAAQLPLPKRVFAHGWWTNEGRKISKSLGNVIDPLQLIKTYGLDQIRFALLREVPFGNDGDFSHRAVTLRINSELANDLGNLAQRVLSMVYKNCDGRTVDMVGIPLTIEDEKLLNAARAMAEPMRAAMDVQAFQDALEIVWGVVRAANGYVDRQAPWVLRKEDPERMAVVLTVLLDCIRRIATVLIPFMPTSCHTMLDQLGIEDAARTIAASAGEDFLPHPSVVLGKPEGVFPRIAIEEEATKAEQVSSC